MEITEEILKEFKQRIKIFHDTEDKNLRQILSACFLAIQNSCGKFDFTNELGKELVFERARYAYNDSLEFFTNNFLTEILNLSISLMEKKESENDGDNVKI